MSENMKAIQIQYASKFGSTLSSNVLSFKCRLEMITPVLTLKFLRHLFLVLFTLLYYFSFYLFIS